MHDILRSTVLTALLATSATAWAETSVSPVIPVSPVPLIALAPGRVVHVDSEGSRNLAECEQVEERKWLAGPQKGMRFEERQPCSLWFLAVHPSTGRWAMSLSIDGDEGTQRLVSVTLAGRNLEVPRSKSGRAKQGSFLVMGDMNGVVGVTPGVATQWTEDNVHHSQMPLMFTADGARVLVTNGTVTTTDWWSWSFGARPEGIRVLPVHQTDTAGNVVFSGESRTVLRHDKGGVRIATMDPTGTKPWKVGPPLKQKRKGMLSPMVIGDTMVFYREGTRDEGGNCEGADSATYRRVDLRTGQEKVWKTHDTYCSSYELTAGSPRRKSVFFIESNYFERKLSRLYEYSVERDEVRMTNAEGFEGAHDISEDGRTLLLFDQGHSVAVYDVDADEYVWLKGLGRITDAGLLNPR
ncbi:hypothetical protein SAMN05443572_104172 [Myxococcus fulvus]|uniref:Lipoprotein n=1 Tax=Myxococcus fulvus TaxID=33 RepID=A0A511T0T3_MYXFU|nr:hypothetical protein [Myxococcus fulvus]GEN07203.1 hypothetical protein MFU01_22400 [Myxococcus fulvus]SET97906.1 hypothetical protein SAMN05443572_104172 [Myxococcus fulvus]